MRTEAYIRVGRNGLIKPGNSRIGTHPRLKMNMAYFRLHIESSELCLNFDNPDDMIDFCEKHNFPYEDERTGVEKYLARKQKPVVTP